MECSGFWYLWTAHRRLFLVSQRHGLSCGRLGIVGVDCLQFIHVGDEDNGIRQNLLFPQQRQVYRRQQFAGTDAVALVRKPSPFSSTVLMPMCTSSSSPSSVSRQ